MGITRKTKSVKSVISIFENNSDAQSVVHLVDLLKREMNKTTVYRILERLENEKLVHSFVGKDGLKWYAKCTDCCLDEHKDIHPHFQCKDCGKTQCVKQEITMPLLPNYQIDTVEVLFYGLCEQCSI
ncbi:transcriptional repressor [Nonlabens mediterrranea]|uniref:Transcriptional repressor n=1 Tax=Nonlabens mediterrranea TaxID=1419947 RepID=A0ABS0A3U8_9FLAO|nr:conserved hypothetical protein [Flavobacteria bacterium BBFL7]MBF4983574.1 transcriptional repressor [Nonlabens mediterrranea]